MLSFVLGGSRCRSFPSCSAVVASSTGNEDDDKDEERDEEAADMMDIWCGNGGQEKNIAAKSKAQAEDKASAKASAPPPLSKRVQRPGVASKRGVARDCASAAGPTTGKQCNALIAKAQTTLSELRRAQRAELAALD